MTLVVARAHRPVGRILLLAAAAGAALLVLVSWADRRRPLELLPAGAGCALQAAGVAEVVERLEGTRFAAALSASGTRAWLEESPAVTAFDAARAEVGRATGFTPTRKHLLDIVGTDTAVGWYPRAAAGPAGNAPDDAPWLAACRLSWRAWGIATALRAWSALGLGGAQLARESVAGTSVVSVGSGSGAVHLFFVGRLLVAGNERELVRRSIRVETGAESPLTSEEAWVRVFTRLPASAALRVWARGDCLPLLASAAEGSPVRAAGAVVSAGTPVELDLFVDAPARGPSARPAPSPPPALALAGEAPLLFFSTGNALPPPLARLLAQRAADVARFDRADAAPQFPPLGSGYAFAVTAAAEGLFPLPEGLVAVRMRDEQAARAALRMLYPAGARTAPSRWGTALATRESLPLAGEFELWGAAAGATLLFATRASLLEALEKSAHDQNRGAAFVPDAAWPFDTVTTLNAARALPLLRRYAAPLTGLARARYPGSPDLGSDLALLQALRSVAVISGTSDHGTLARITVDVGDFAATASPGRALPPGR